MNAQLAVMPKPKKARAKRYRDRGTGSVYQSRFTGADGTQQQGRWRVRFSWRDVTGDHHRHDEAAPDRSDGTWAGKEDAKTFLAKRMKEAHDRTLVIGTDAENVTYTDLREMLLQEYRNEKHKTLKVGKNKQNYISGLRQLDSFFTGYKAIAITSKAIESFKESRLKEGVGNCAVNRPLQLLGRMFSLAVENEALPESTVPSIRKLAEPKARAGFLEHADFLKLRAALPEDLRPVLTVAFYTGMRLGEIIGLRWENVDFEHGFIRLHDTKNGEPRNVPLAGELPEMLKCLQGRSDFVFTRKNGERLMNFRKRWNRACALVGLGRFEEGIYSGLIFHDLRRSGVRNLVRAGVPRDVARKISGHKSDAVFSRYNITDERDLTLAGEQVAAYLASKV